MVELTGLAGKFDISREYNQDFPGVTPGRPSDRSRTAGSTHAATGPATEAEETTVRRNRRRFL
jgi:hypothetical protein